MRNLRVAITWMGLSFYLLIKVHKDISGEIIKITNKDKIRLNSSLIERQVYQGNQQPSLFDAQYTSSIANTTNHGIHWLDGNKQVIE
ncbi:hypothetical protein [Klebsiella pneumoniae]|uniref:hypothetical protein n=1 Tax=Klebsiella pneumoniae TaxID=573 RepID=UPI0022B6B5AA|nr:hypothetical protein [Klebsiella pneumoniae]